MMFRLPLRPLNRERPIFSSNRLPSLSSRKFLIEDDAGLAADLRHFLEEEGWEVECATSVQEARSKLIEKIFDLLVADYLLPDANVLSLFKEVQLRSPL